MELYRNKDGNGGKYIKQEVYHGNQVKKMIWFISNFVSRWRWTTYRWINYKQKPPTSAQKNTLFNYFKKRNEGNGIKNGNETNRIKKRHVMINNNITSDNIFFNLIWFAA